MKIMSKDRKHFYEVTHSSCTCPDFVYRQAQKGDKCKHMIQCFYQVGSVRYTQFNEHHWFKGGADINESHSKFGDDKIKHWLDIHEICEHIVNGKKMYWLLE